LIRRLPPGFRVLAPNLRGFGPNDKPVDATRGLKDFSDDVEALLQIAFEDEPVQVIGHSVGAGVALELALSYPTRVKSLVLVAPMSPFGFGGTRDEKGTPCASNFAGSGAGLAHPDFIERLRKKDRSSSAPTSPLAVMRSHYFHSSFVPEPALEQELLDAVLSTRTGDDHYPGDIVTTDTWPGFAPGRYGINNALSPKWCNLSSFAELPAPPPVLWIRGECDRIVSDQSDFCAGALGRAGMIPGWPGPQSFPPQPMLEQTRAVLSSADLQEVVMPGVGHTPFIENPTGFLDRALPFLADFR
jgi:pimeloyl-ACP methyl ester carboxylesterase